MRLLVAEDEKDLNDVITKTLIKTTTLWIPAKTAGKPLTAWPWLNTTP